jgi:hypothetical protein
LKNNWWNSTVCTCRDWKTRHSNLSLFKNTTFKRNCEMSCINYDEKRGERERKNNTLKAHNNSDYDTISIIRKNPDETNLTTIRKVTNSDQSMSHLLPKNDGWLIYLWRQIWLTLVIVMIFHGVVRFVLSRSFQWY